MKNLLKSLVLACIVNFGITSCSIQDEVLPNDNTEVLSTTGHNQDDDPVIEDPNGD